jgi:sulfoxide reductase heme-binding subunit YedZ
MESLIKFLNSKYFAWLVLALPMVLMVNAWLTGDLFYGEMIHASGEFSARLAMLTLAITPFRLMLPNARWPLWLLHRRRYLGVAAFAYALLHTVVYIDRKRDLGLIVDEGLEFAMWTGWVAFLIFIILAVTSNDTSVRVLRRTWKKIHRWIYVAALLLFAHWIFTAFDFVPGLIHFAILMALETYRLWKRGKLGRNAT